MRSEIIMNIHIYFTILYFQFFPFILAQYQYLVEVFEKTPLGGRRTISRCDATGADFGDMTFKLGDNTHGCAMPTSPRLACSSVKMQISNHTYCLNNFALVSRGNCSFSQKAYFVQTALPKGYDALIMYNYKGEGPIPMSGGPYKNEIDILVIMVDYICMQNIISHSADKGYLVSIKSSPGYYELIKYLVPFLAIVGFCFLVLFVSLLVRICRERRRLAKKRLSRRHLRKIPVKKWRKGDPDGTCAICLEDFKDGDKLRILECKHAYHCKCIDPWLLKSRKICPVCKRKVGPRSKDDDSSDSDTDRTTVVNTRENDSLLRNAQPMASSSNPDFSSSLPLSSYIDETGRHSTNIINSGHVSENQFLRTFRTIIRPLQNAVSRPVTSASVETGHTTESNDVSNNVDDPESTDARSNMLLRDRFLHLGTQFLSLFRRNDNPHIQLNNEDSSTTREELGLPHSSSTFNSARISSPIELSGSSSLDGHSMTTIRSNREIIDATEICELQQKDVVSITVDQNSVMTSNSSRCNLTPNTL